MAGGLSAAGEGPARAAPLPGAAFAAGKAEARYRVLVEQIPAITFLAAFDDSDFASRSLNNFLWVTFTRSDPAADLHGIGAAMRQKHFGCAGSVVIDARIKPHHAPPLVEDAGVSRSVDALAAPGGPLHRII